MSKILSEIEIICMNPNHALIIIDLIQDFSPKELNPNAPLPVEQLSREKRIKINNFIQWASEQGFTIIFIRDCHFPEQFEKTLEIPHALIDTPGREFMSWLKLPKEFLEFEKYGYNAVQNPIFRKFLQERNFDIIGIFGTSTGVCVYQSWRAISTLTDSKVFLLEDGCGDMFPQRHKQTIQKIEIYWPDKVISIQDFQRLTSRLDESKNKNALK